MRINIDRDASMALTPTGNAKRPIVDSFMYYPQAKAAIGRGRR